MLEVQAGGRGQVDATVPGLDLVKVYLDEIGRFPLLTKEDEAHLAQAIEAGRGAKEQLAGNAHELSPRARRKLLLVAEEGDAAFERFVNCNLRLVVFIAAKYRWSGLPLLDLVQDGNAGLVHAVEKFDWRKGFKFSTYATWWVRQAIGRSVDNTAHSIKVPAHVGDKVRQAIAVQHNIEAVTGRAPSLVELAEELDADEQTVALWLARDVEPVSLDAEINENNSATLGDMVADRSGGSVEDVATDSLTAEHLARAMSCLSDKERTVIEMRFAASPAPCDKIATVLHMSRRNVQLIEHSALGKLRRFLGEEGRDLLTA